MASFAKDCYYSQVRYSDAVANIEGRPTCYSCMRPHTHCVCNLIAPFNAHFKILILQHPHERKKYYGTAKLVIKAIRNSTLIRGLDFEQAQLDGAIMQPNTFLLYPSKTAVDCETAKLDSNSTVIILDGTWDEAGKILHRNPRLRDLPHLTFRSDFRSNYKIRKQPKENYLSTIESIAHLLKLNAIGTAHAEKCSLYDSLFDGFNKMVRQQAEYVPHLKSSPSSHPASC